MSQRSFWLKVVFSTLIHGYHNFTSITSYQQNCYRCQPKFNVVSTLTSKLNQSWQYGVDLTLISSWPTSLRDFNIYQRWNNVGSFLGIIWKKWAKSILVTFRSILAAACEYQFFIEWFRSKVLKSSGSSFNQSKTFLPLIYVYNKTANVICTIVLGIQDIA